MENTLKRPDLIIWDWDGTLVDSLPLIFMAHNHVREMMSLPLWTREEFQIIAHNSTRDAYRAEYGARADEAIVTLYEYIQEHHLNQFRFIVGAKDVVKACKALNVPMIIVSNKRHHFLLKEVSFSGLEKNFISIVGAGEAAHDKPHADHVRLALNQADIDINSISTAWFIGDSQADIDCAKAAPIMCQSILIGSANAQGYDVRYRDLDMFMRAVQCHCDVL